MPDPEDDDDDELEDDDAAEEGDDDDTEEEFDEMEFMEDVAEYIGENFPDDVEQVEVRDNKDLIVTMLDETVYRLTLHRER